MARGESLRPTYPGLIPQEVEIWRRWLRDHETEFDRFEYNVKVGPGLQQPITDPSIPTQLRQALERMWTSLTRMRADVVAHAGPQLWVIEVKVEAAPGILGQVLSYQHALAQDRSLNLAPQAAIVCGHVRGHLLPVLESNGVVVYQVDVGGGPGMEFPPVGLE